MIWPELSLKACEIAAKEATPWQRAIILGLVKEVRKQSEVQRKVSEWRQDLLLQLEECPWENGCCLESAVHYLEEVLDAQE